MALTPRARAGRRAGRQAGRQECPSCGWEAFPVSLPGGSLIIIYPPQAAQRPAKEQHGAVARAQPGGQESWIVVSALPHALSPAQPSHLFLSGDVRGIRFWEGFPAQGLSFSSLGCQPSRAIMGLQWQVGDRSSLRHRKPDPRGVDMEGSIEPNAI